MTRKKFVENLIHSYIEIGIDYETAKICAKKDIFNTISSLTLNHSKSFYELALEEFSNKEIKCFKVIAEYPKSEFKKGDILYRIERATNNVYHTNKYAPIGGLYLHEIEKYPHLFKRI